MNYLKFLGNYGARVCCIIFHVVFFVLFFRFFVLEIGLVDGQSMEPTLRDDTVFFVNKLGPLVFPFKRFDIIQHVSPLDHQKILVKRIIGLPGETVIFKLNSIFIRNAAGRELRLEEKYLYPDIFTNIDSDGFNEFSVPDHAYFVLGDNRLFSADSRVYGFVHRSLILGKVIH